MKEKFHPKIVCSLLPLFGVMMMTSAPAASVMPVIRVLEFDELTNKYSDAGVAGGGTSSDFLKINGDIGAIGADETSPGGGLVTKDTYFTPVNLNKVSVSFKARVRGKTPDFTSTRPVYLGLTPADSANKLIGTGLSDNSPDTAGPGADYWGGSVKATTRASDSFQINARQYDDGSDVFTQEVMGGMGLSSIDLVEVNISYNGVDTLTVRTLLRDSTKVELSSVSRSFSNVAQSDVDLLRPFIFMSADVGETVGIYDVTMTVTSVPEPSSVVLMALGGIPLILRRRK